jgi:NADH-quinone oxidoreductase subunit E
LAFWKPLDLDVSDYMEVSQISESIREAEQGDLIPILQNVQKEYGHLPQDVLMEISEQASIPASRIYGVATFYEQFYLEPRGRHTIKCCRGTACHVKNVNEIISAISRLLNIEPNQTTEDMRFTFETVACLGTCFLAPVMMVNNDYYGNLEPKQIEGILKKYD